MHEGVLDEEVLQLLLSFVVVRSVQLEELRVQNAYQVIAEKVNALYLSEDFTTAVLFRAYRRQDRNTL